jgi:2'-5' RNA ligase
VWDGLAPVRARFPETRWIKPELLHLTLVFMGQVDAQRVAQLEAALAAVARRHDAFLTTTSGASGHIDDRPGARRGGVAWLTLEDGYRATVALSLDVDDAIASHTYDARRRPRPHLTVARAVDEPALAALRDFAPSLRLEWRTSELVLYRSFTGAGGSRYEALSRSSLRGK